MNYLTRNKIIGAVIVSVLMLIFFLQNMESVPTTVLFFDFPMPLVFLLLLTFIIGIVVGLLIALSISRKHREPPS